MKKYKVDYVGFDTMEFRSIRGTKIVEAESKEAAKRMITDQSEMGGYEYFVERVREVVEDE